MLRHALLILFLAVVWLGGGCTASDRDYVRNHIVLRDQSNSTNQIAHHSPAR